MLQKIYRKKNLVVVGLNAGTSADGLDLAAVKINLDSMRPKIKFIEGQTVNYPPTLRQSVYDAINNKLKSIDDIIRLDRRLGCFYGDRANQFMLRLRKKKINPDLIASHGQTVRHLPGQVYIGQRKESGTLQLGHPESISERCNLITVADFRQSDIAAGGEGAPITSYAMWLLFGQSKESRILINIGGIANFFLFPAAKPADKMLAADCGPGNTLVDILTMRYFGKKYDRAGRLAKKGKTSLRLLTTLLADNYLKGKYGPSTGRERFGEEFADRIVKQAAKLHLNKYDTLATATELTSTAIYQAVDKYRKKYAVKNIYLFGGGLKNKFMMQSLEDYFSDTEIISVDTLGVNPDYLEAVCYGIMGALAVKGYPSGLPGITGAKRKTIAGRIILPSRE